MMSIDECNGIVKETIYNNMTKSNKYFKNIDEFGFYQYTIFTEGSDSICFGFKSEDFNKIFEYSGKECLASDFANFPYELNYSSLGNKFSVLLKIDISKYKKIHEKIPSELSAEEKEYLMMENEKLKKELEQVATAYSVLFGKFRIIYYSSVIKKMVSELLEKKTPEIFTLKLNSNNILYLLPLQEKIMLLYGINFSQKTDISLARVFLQELEDSKRHVRNSVEAKYYPDFSRPPLELKDIEKNPKQYACGIISFNIFIKNYPSLQNRMSYFINFRNYIQFHIHSIKAYLHIRMNKKGKELEKKLNDTKIIPDEYLKNLETQSFYSALQKKDDDVKLFTSDFKKLNV